MDEITTPTKILLHKQSKMLELIYGDTSYSLSFELLRVHSPSAEVKGHGPGQQVLQVGKKNVSIDKLEMTGNYALRIIYDDGHESGIYTWEYLFQLCQEQNSLWQKYLDDLHRANKSRDPSVQVVTLMEPTKPI